MIFDRAGVASPDARDDPTVTIQELLHGGGWIMVGEAGGGSAVGDSPGFLRIIRDVCGISTEIAAHDHRPNHDFRRPRQGGCGRRLARDRLDRALLRERLAAARVAKMQATRQKLSATGTPPMTAEEIEAEIQAYRAERRRAAGA